MRVSWFHGGLFGCDICMLSYAYSCLYTLNSEDNPSKPHECCSSFIIHSYTAHCTALTTNARTLHIPRPRKNTPMPSVRYACLAISIELNRVLWACVGNSMLCSPCPAGACRICVCTLVLMTSNGKMDAQVITPARPPHNSTFIAVSLSESCGELQACLDSS